MKRFVLEGTCRGGYLSSQDRVCHREVIGPKRAERLTKLYSIPFSDGSCLIINVRPAEHRERIIPKLGYTSLILEWERKIPEEPK